MSDLNKTLRFCKQNADVIERFPKLTDNWKDLSFIAFSDAALGVRRDLGSQGGYIIIAVGKDVMEEKAGRYACVAWQSYRLTRVCRSSLAAESQACATAVDELMMVKMQLHMVINSMATVKDIDIAKGKTSFVVIDARALFDAINKENIQSAVDKRVAVETLVIKDGLKHTNAELRWVLSERQLADGLTKIGGRHQLCDLLRGGYIQLVYDETFTAAKKKTIQERKEVNRVARGTAAAQYVAALVAADILGAEAAEVDNSCNVVTMMVHEENYTAYFRFFEHLLVFALAMLIVVLLVKVQQFSRIRTIRMRDAITQTEESGELQEIIERSEVLTRQIRRLEDENNWLYSHDCPYRIYVTPHGRKWRKRWRCTALQGRCGTGYTRCLLCCEAEAEEED